MSEQKVLASCIKSRKAWETITKHLTSTDITEQSNLLLRYIAKYYENDPSAGSVDTESVLFRIKQDLPNKKHHTTFENLVTSLTSLSVSPPNIIEDFLALKREAAGQKLAAALLAPSGTVNINELVEEYERWNKASTLVDPELQYTVWDINTMDRIKETLSEGQLITIQPKALNERLGGGMYRGQHLTIFARPEMGKTAFLINIAAGVIRQGLKVLYIGNEEPTSVTYTRLVSRLTRRTFTDVFDNWDEVKQDAIDNHNLSYFTAVDLTPGTATEIDLLVDHYKPDVVIVDQLRNLRANTGKDGNFTRQLEINAMEMRAIAGKYKCLMVTATQAGASADHKAITEMGDVDSSNTGIPAACDVMVGMGGSDDDLNNGRRILTLVKNKRTNDHSYFPVKLYPLFSMLTSGD